MRDGAKGFAGQSALLCYHGSVEEKIKQFPDAQQDGLIVSGRGGARPGAGRPKGSTHRVRWLVARGIAPAVAAEILSAVRERAQWVRVFNSDDDRVVLDALKFLVTMRDGKPVQQISVTSTNLTVSVADIERAREIARELARSLREGEASPKLGMGTVGDNGEVIEGEVVTIGDTSRHDISSDAQGINENANIMVAGGEGGKKDGDGR